MSFTGFSEAVAIHQDGKTNGMQQTSSTPYKRSFVLRLIEGPPPPHPPLQDRQREHDDEEQQRDGGAVAEVMELERLLVQVVDEHGRRRTRTALRQYCDLREHLQ